MTIVELKKDLGEALVSLDRDGTLAADRVERLAGDIQRIDSTPPNPGSWLFSANMLRETQANPARLRAELTIIIAKVEEKFRLPGSGS
jgi:hypothetical protein